LHYSNIEATKKAVLSIIGQTQMCLISHLVDDPESRIRRSKFTNAEDQQLSALVGQFGETNWPLISGRMPGRTVRQCRDRWNHYLAPETKVVNWSADEDRLLLENIRVFGKQWSKLTPLFPGRTGIAIRNHFCKLARQKNSDPILKTILFDERRKKIRLDLTDARELGKGEGMLPSCRSMLMEASVAEDATELYPVNGRMGKKVN
jgi:hypothetical protein